MKDNKFTMIDESGQEREYDVLFTFESEETNKNYILSPNETNIKLEYDEIRNVKIENEKKKGSIKIINYV